jgi:hypothetical protein
VFGVSCDEFLCYALDNRTEWEAKGQGIVARMLEEAEFTYGELENPEILVRRLKLGSAGQEQSADGAANVGTPIVEETTPTKGEVSDSGVEIPEGSASEPTGSVSEESRDAQFLQLVSIEEATASIVAVTPSLASESNQGRKSGLRVGERADIRFL